MKLSNIVPLNQSEMTICPKKHKASRGLYHTVELHGSITKSWILLQLHWRTRYVKEKEKKLKIELDQ